MKKLFIDDKFFGLLSSLDSKFNQLIEMIPQKSNDLPNNTPKGGVYLFSEQEKHLYCGRTKRIIKDRIKNHYSTGKDCPFAWRLAREETGNVKASYFGDKTRLKLLEDENFGSIYKKSKKRIKNMDVRYVEENDPLKQALLEIYVSVVLNTPYNDFDTH